VKEYRYFTLLTGLFVAVLLISNVASSKLVALGPFVFDGGTILFPVSYIFGDILTEVYGYRKSRQVIWIGFFCAMLMMITFIVVGWLPAGGGWENQSSYDKILGLTPRIVIGSLLAYFAGEFSNAFTLAKMKILTRGRWLFSRTIGSTIIGQGVDTAIFVLAAFAGIYSWDVLSLIILSNYVFKVAFEIILTPVTYWTIGILKKRENSDIYDIETNFNPFKAFWDSRPGAESGLTRK
jgi:queuosine precursor transporter